MTASPVYNLFTAAPFAAGGSDINDDFVVEISLCYAGDGKIVCAGHDGFTLHTWVVDITSPTAPVFGDRQMWYASGSSYAPDDPDGWFFALSDLNRLVSPSAGVVALCGETSDDFGGEAMISDIFTVNSNNSLTRSNLVKTTYFFDIPTIDRWDDKVVVVDADADSGWFPADAGNAPVFVVDPSDGSFVVRSIDSADLAAFGSANIGPIAVSGDMALMFCHPSGEFTDYAPLIMDLTDGSYVVHATIPEIGDQNYSWFLVGLEDGWGLTYTLDSFSGNVVYTTISTSGAKGADVVVSDGPARTVGFTGGWKSNVRSIAAWPDGTPLVGYPGAWVTIDSGTATPGEAMPLAVTDTSNLLGYQVVALEQGFVAGVAMDSSAAPGSFQFAYTYGARSITGAPGPNRRRFVRSS